MKVATLILALTAVIVAATSTPSAVDVVTRNIDCGACKNRYDFCIKVECIGVSLTYAPSLLT